MLSAVLSFAIEDGTIAHKLVKGMGKLYKVDRADKIWVSDDISALEAVASPALVLGLHLGLQAGQREKDAIELPCLALDNFGIGLTQSKPGQDVCVPWQQRLAQAAISAPESVHTHNDEYPGETMDPRWFQDQLACMAVLPPMI